MNHEDLGCFGDLKPDYADLIGSSAGRSSRSAEDKAVINVLDRGGTARQQVLADAHGRKLTMVGALITILRG